MDIHLLCCAHGNERIGTHDVIRKIFVTIMQNVNFHMGQKELHVLLSITFNSSHWQINIVFIKDGICTLVDVVIANPTQTGLLVWFYTIQGFVASNAVQTKKRSYHNQHPTINSSL